MTTTGKTPRFVMVKDALPVGTRVQFYDASWTPRGGHKWRKHYRDEAVIVKFTSGHSKRGHEVFQYHIKFSDGCMAYVNPWQVTRIDSDGL